MKDLNRECRGNALQSNNCVNLDANFVRAIYTTRYVLFETQ